MTRVPHEFTHLCDRRHSDNKHSHTILETFPLVYQTFVQALYGALCCPRAHTSNSVRISSPFHSRRYNPSCFWRILRQTLSILFWSCSYDLSLACVLLTHTATCTPSRPHALLHAEESGDFLPSSPCSSGLSHSCWRGLACFVERELIPLQ